MEAIVQKWGNSLAVRIPKSISKGTHLVEGSSVSVAVENGTIVLKPTGKPSLQQVLDKITESNVHSEVITGNHTGNEIW
jgi:antitoxin MazE